MSTLYVAYLRASTGVLIGGVKYHISTRFETQEQAQDWLDVIYASNKLAGRNIGEHGVKSIRVKDREV